jgi:hypothetical protein
MTPPGIDPGTSGLVAQYLNHYATPGPLKKFVTNLKFKENCEENVITLTYILPNEDMLGGISELLSEEPHCVTKLTTAYGAGTCSLHVLSLLTEGLENMLH